MIWNLYQKNIVPNFNSFRKSHSMVVHVKSKYVSNEVYGYDPLWRRYFNQPMENISGSGVIISDDGYIITNSRA